MVKKTFGNIMPSFVNELQEWYLTAAHADGGSYTETQTEFEIHLLVMAFQGTHI